MYSFWNSSISLPTLVTNDVVLDKLIDGADLFAPGISQASIATLPDDLPEGSIVGIGTTSVKNAIRGIGRLCLHSSKLKSNPAGKAVEVLHVEGDQLWALGNKSTAQPREIATSAMPVADSSTNGQPEAVEGSDETQAGQDGSKEASTPQGVLTTAGTQAVSFRCEIVCLISCLIDVDAMLKEAVIYAISQILSKQSNVFPLTSSKFMDTYVLPSRRASVAAAGHEVSIKKSSFKNASAFLKMLKKEGLIGTKEAKGGEVNVISVDASHPE